MVLAQCFHFMRTSRQICPFLLLLLNVALAEEVDGNIAIPSTTLDPYQTTREVNWNAMLRPTQNAPNLQYKSRAVLRKFLIRHRVIPDVLAVAPSYIMDVVFTRKSVVNLGNKMDPALLQSLPRSIVWPWKNESLYTLVLVDPDVPKRQNPIFAQRVHWLVVNIPGKYLHKGEHVVEYLGPIAPPRTGMHRYVFTVFKQYSKLYYEEKIIKTRERFDDSRLNFSIRGFSMKYKLRDPIAVNFFLSGWPLDQPVPQVDVPTKKPKVWTTSTAEPSMMVIT